METSSGRNAGTHHLGSKNRQAAERFYCVGGRDKRDSVYGEIYILYIYTYIYKVIVII